MTETRTRKCCSTPTHGKSDVTSGPDRSKHEIPDQRCKAEDCESDVAGGTLTHAPMTQDDQREEDAHGYRPQDLRPHAWIVAHATSARRPNCSTLTESLEAA